MEPVNIFCNNKVTPPQTLLVRKCRYSNNLSICANCCFSRKDSHKQEKTDSKEGSLRGGRDYFSKYTQVHRLTLTRQLWKDTYYVEKTLK